MPNSLKCRLKKLEHQGLLSEKDLSRIYTDKDVVEELEKIKADLLNLEFNFHYDWFTTKHIIEIIDNHISELKGE